MEDVSTSDPDRASERLSRLVDAILESGRILPPKVSMVSIPLRFRENLLVM